MSVDRRGFLQAVLAAGVAPAFIGSKVLMPVSLVLSAQRYEWEVGSDYVYTPTIITSGCWIVSDKGGRL